MCKLKIPQDVIDKLYLNRIELLGIKGYFSELKIASIYNSEYYSKIPIKTDSSEGFYRYEIRHSDEDLGEPVQIRKSIWVNFYGTLLMEKELNLDENGDIYFNDEMEEALYTVIE